VILVTPAGRVVIIFTRHPRARETAAPALSEMPVMDSPLKREFDFYLKNQDALVRQYNGKVVAIKNERVIGAYPDVGTAVAETQKTEPLGTFLVQKVEPGAAAYTQTFHSRVAFAR
jgi:hypothetical protein